MSEKDISEINIIYDINGNNYINIFGYFFVENNKNICKMIINNKEYELAQYYKDKINNNNKLKIKLKGINHITNMRSMFSDCSSLISLSDISKWNTNNVTHMTGMFCGCSSLISLPDISKWNTNKVYNMTYMFYNFLHYISLIFHILYYLLSFCKYFYYFPQIHSQIYLWFYHLYLYHKLYLFQIYLH